VGSTLVALRHGVRHHTVDADRREHERDASKRAPQEHQEPRPRRSRTNTCSSASTLMMMISWHAVDEGDGRDCAGDQGDPEKSEILFNTGILCYLQITDWHL
jgi:hypothetical protein